MIGQLKLMLCWGKRIHPSKHEDSGIHRSNVNGKWLRPHVRIWINYWGADKGERIIFKCLITREVSWVQFLFKWSLWSVLNPAREEGRFNGGAWTGQKRNEKYSKLAYNLTGNWEAESSLTFKASLQILIVWNKSNASAIVNTCAMHRPSNCRVGAPGPLEIWSVSCWTSFCWQFLISACKIWVIWF